jgi:hypothetical protein
MTTSTLKDLWRKYEDWIVAILLVTLGLQTILWSPFRDTEYPEHSEESLFEYQLLEYELLLEEYNSILRQLIENEKQQQEINKGRMWSA